MLDRFRSPAVRGAPSRAACVILALLGLCLATSSAPAQRWASVSVGDDHACALDVAGRAFCWGYNHSAQLGARTETRCGITSESGHRSCYPVPSEALPLAVRSDVPFASISAGRYVTCALDRGGKAFCWGGALTDTAAYADRCLDDVPCSFAPVPLAAGRAFASVNATYRCGVGTGGEATCWSNAPGSDVRVASGWPGLALASLDGRPGTDDACAVLRDGAAMCRGDGLFGLLGNGSRDTSASPVRVSGPVRFASVAVMEHWACALSREGQAYCWGAAGYDDIHDDQAPAGFEVCPRWGTRTRCNTRPAVVAGALRFRDLTRLPRSSAMLGLTADGRAFTWGGDRVPAAWHADQRWASIGAGDWGVCGVTRAGELFCWGRNPHDAVQGRIAHP